MRWGVIGMTGALLVAVLALSSTPAMADPPPPYDGTMTFPAISDPSGQSEFSWQVQLGEGQALEQVNDQLARVYYTEDSVTALSILPGAAHDSNGASVPTSLGVSGGNVLTLFVYHQAGNPAAAGAPFKYPIVAGEGWEGGFVTQQIQMPPSKSGQPSSTDQATEANCVVPKLTGRTLKGAKRQLRRSNCRIGKVHKLQSATARTGKVAKQHPRPGRVLASESSIDLTLAAR